MNTHLLLLADSRLPAGGHAHSGGLEPAAAAGTVTDLPGLADFLRGRLATAGLVTAALAAASTDAVNKLSPVNHVHDHDLSAGVIMHLVNAAKDVHDHELWGRLDAEADARMPSPAQRQASRAQGRTLLRVARTTWPHPALEALAGLSRGGPHHPIVLGAVTAAAGGTPQQAAAIAAYGAVTGPAAAAVRLLGLDPLAVHRALAELAPAVDEIAAEAAAAARNGDLAALPALSAPLLDLYAEQHLQSEMRLFES
jgi:urease accessory protein